MPWIGAEYSCIGKSQCHAVDISNQKYNWHYLLNDFHPRQKKDKAAAFNYAIKNVKKQSCRSHMEIIIFDKLCQTTIVFVLITFQKAAIVVDFAIRWKTLNYKVH